MSRLARVLWAFFDVDDDEVFRPFASTTVTHQETHLVLAANGVLAVVGEGVHALLSSNACAACLYDTSVMGEVNPTWVSAYLTEVSVAPLADGDSYAIVTT